MTIINQNIEAINQLCRKHRVKELYAFGSVTDEKKFNEKSDVDLLVDFQEIELLDYSDNYFDLIEQFEEMFKRKVDLISINSLRNPVFKRVLNRTKIPVYKA